MNEWIPVTTRVMTAEEVKEYNEWEYGYPMDEDKENWTYDSPLPDDPCEVLVTTSYGDVRCVEFCRDGNFVWFEGYEDRDDVLAWMSLPKPYSPLSEVADAFRESIALVEQYNKLKEGDKNDCRDY